MHEKGRKKLDGKLLRMPKKDKQKHRHSLTKSKVSHPFWQVFLDIMGPLPKTQENKYIMPTGDQFSKW